MLAWVGVLQPVEAADPAARRLAGLAAFKDGDFITTLALLGPYLADKANTIDPQVIFSYAVARGQVPQVGGKHLPEAISRLRSLLENDPPYLPAQVELLKLYAQAGYQFETLDLAEKILARDPKETQALYYKSVSLSRQRKYQEAFKAVDYLVQLEGENVRALMLRVEMMQRIGKPNDEIVKFAVFKTTRDPEDPRLQLAAAYAYTLVGHSPGARDALRKAAAGKTEDPECVRILVEQLDAAGLYDLSLAFLDKHAKKLGDPGIYRMLVRRLWETARFEEILATVAELNLENRKYHSELIVFKIMSMVSINKQVERVPSLLKMLDDRNDKIESAWKTVLTDLVIKVGNQRDAIDLCRQSLLIDPANPYMHYFRGEALFNVGEYEAALEEWRLAAKLSPTWNVVHIRISQVLSEVNRAAEAIEPARQAVIRTPNNLPAHIAYAQALSSALEEVPNPNPVLQDQLLDLLTRIQQAIPGESGSFPLYIKSLVDHKQKDRAIALVRQMVEQARQSPAQNPPPEKMLIKLALLSRQLKLGVDVECLNLSLQIHKLTPAMAAVIAQIKRIDESPKSARDYWDQIMTNETVAKAPLAWRFEMARDLDQAGDPASGPIWVALTQSHPDHMAICNAALRSKSFLANRAPAEALIHRTKEKVADDEVIWKIAWAQWMLDGQDADKDLITAAKLLNDIVKAYINMPEPRMLLARAFERMGNTAGARDQLAGIVAKQTAHIPALLELARIQHQARDLDSARQYMDRIQALPEPVRQKYKDLETRIQALKKQLEAK